MSSTTLSISGSDTTPGASAFDDQVDPVVLHVVVVMLGDEASHAAPDRSQADEADVDAAHGAPIVRRCRWLAV